MTVRRIVEGILALALVAIASAAGAATYEGPPVTLPGHTLAADIPAKATRLSTGSKALPEDPITLTIVLRRHNELAFKHMLSDLYDPSSPRYRKYLTPQEVADRYGPSESDYDDVRTYFKSKGFTVTGDSANRMTLTLTGTRAAAERATATRISDLQIGDRKFFANEADPALPAEVAEKVQAVVGLSNLAQPTNLNTPHQHHEFEQGCLGAHLGVLTLGVAGFFLFSFFEWPVLGAVEGALGILCFGENLGYNLGHMGNNGPGGGHGHGDSAFSGRMTNAGALNGFGQADGSGQTIGLVQFDTFQKSDIVDYLALIKMPASSIDQLSEVHVNGGAPLGAGASEVLLDITLAMTIAPAAMVVVYDAPLGASFQSVFNAAINGGSTIISNSWAYCEDQTTLSDVQSLDSLFQTAAASGISIFNASGDTGSTCLDGAPNTVAVPASAPSATAVGGSSMQATSALTYGSETWWNGAAGNPPTGQGGFGVSKFFSRPAYQNGFTASAFRSVPDVVSNADPARGVEICQANNGGCPSGKWYGGTSMTAPTWAALTARLNQALGTNVGAANSSLYPLAATTAFRPPSSMASDFAHVGIGSPNMVELFLKLSGKTAGLPDPALSTVIPLVAGADSGKVVGGGYPADGTTEVLVRVQLFDANYNTVPGKTVAVTKNAGSSAVITTVNNVTTVNNGTAVFKVTNAAFETVTLTVTDTTDGIVLIPLLTIPFAAPPAASGGINASPILVLNDGVAATTITITLQDALARPSPGKLIQLGQGSGRSIITGPNPSVTNAAGQIVFTATNTFAEAVTYTATDVTDGNLPVPGSALVTYSGTAPSSCAGTGVPTAATGFTLTAVATGFNAQDLFYGNVNWGCRGAQNPAFTADGFMYVTQFLDGSTYKLPKSGGAASSGNKLAAIGPALFNAVVGKDGKLYASRGATTGNFFTGAIVEIDPVTGAQVRVVMPNLTCPNGIVVDPISGDLFTGDICSGAGSDNPSLWRISNPGSATPTLSVYATLPGTPTGWIAMAPDGTIYMAQTITSGAAPVLAISGTDKPQPATMTPVPGLTTIYWVTVGESLPNGAAKSLIVLQGTTIRLADITTNPPTFTDLLEGLPSGMIGPDGCLYASSNLAIYKLTPNSGGCGFAVTSPAPDLRLTPTAAAVAQGTPLSLSAVMANLAIPAGTPVRFQIGDANPQTIIGNTDATGKATAVLTGEFTGVDDVQAETTVGTTTYRSNLARVTWTSGKHSTSLTLNTSPESTPAGQVTPVRATLIDTSLKPAAPIAGATIQFTVNALSCNAVTNASGAATCNVTPPTPGNRILSATYAGNGTYLAAGASQTLQVVGPASTSLTTSVSPVQVGSPFTLTATVTATTPTGTVSFRNALVPLPACTAVPLVGAGNAKTAQCMVTSLGVGSYALTADYSGDGTNLPSTATLIEVVAANAVPACGGFSDVDPISIFCPNVEWLGNRGVTLGCTAGLYCPASPVIRLSMAAFMNRLGSALTDTVLAVQGNTGALNPDLAAVVCQTTDFAITSFPRHANVAAVLSAQGAANMSFVAEPVASFDAGVTWAPLAAMPVSASTTTAHYGNVRASGQRDLDVGQTVRFGLRASRGGLPGAGGFTAGTCNLRATIGNRNPNYSPLDP